LGDVSVKVNGVNIPLYFVSSQQINAQMPFETAAGDAAVSVTNSLGTSDPVPFKVAPAAVGIFEYSGSNRAIAMNQDGSFNSPDNPELRGRVVVLYLTGQGPVSPPVPTSQAAPGDVLSAATLPKSASIGGADATIQFLGLAPGFIGLAQANVSIPADAPAGDVVPLIITVGGQPSNSVTISVR
jgi:adhesin/invasin